MFDFEQEKQEEEALARLLETAGYVLRDGGLVVDGYGGRVPTVRIVLDVSVDSITMPGTVVEVHPDDPRIHGSLSAPILAYELATPAADVMDRFLTALLERVVAVEGGVRPARRVSLKALRKAGDALIKETPRGFS